MQKTEICGRLPPRRCVPARRALLPSDAGLTDTNKLKVKSRYVTVHDFRSVHDLFNFHLKQTLESTSAAADQDVAAAAFRGRSADGCEHLLSSGVHSFLEASLQSQKLIMFCFHVAKKKKCPCKFNSNLITRACCRMPCLRQLLSLGISC